MVPPPNDAQDESAPVRPRRRRRWIRRALAGTAALLLVSVAGGLVYVRSTPFGGSASGERLARMQKSPQWHDGGFVNPQPPWVSLWDGVTGSFGSSDTSSPNPAPDIPATDTGLFDDPPASGLRVTWFGHSSSLVEIDGVRVLIDPFWGERAGPSGLFGAKPFFPAPATPAGIGTVDAVVISHDHWDHLDQPTVSAMAGRAPSSWSRWASVPI